MFSRRAVNIRATVTIGVSRLSRAIRKLAFLLSHGKIGYSQPIRFRLSALFLGS